MRLRDSDYHKVPRKGLEAKMPGNIEVSGLGCNVDLESLSQHPPLLFVPGQHPVETKVEASGTAPI
jgi:hypothetical protein